jgi:hypothetical protein
MNSKKQKTKDRRRARKLAEQAWEAAALGNLDLAEKIVRRAVAARVDNPVLWNDQGLILGLRQKDDEAGESFRTALSLAPTFPDPYAHLAAMRMRQGFLREAVVLQTQAVKCAPKNDVYAERLVAYQSLADAEGVATKPVPMARATPAMAEDQHLDRSSPELKDDFSTRLMKLDWRSLRDRLTQEGGVLIAGLLDAQACKWLCNQFDDMTLFAKTVVMDRPEFGLGMYRYFRAPIPDMVDQLRRAVYPYAANIANLWRELLGESDRYSETWEGFRDQCRAAGQSTPTPILLKYGPGGFNALHRDLRGAVYFPIQMAVVLSPRADPENPNADGFHGGEFLLCDVPESKKSRCRRFAAGLGDVLLFCTRDRLAPVGGTYGLQPVKHGVAVISRGTRYVLGLPFHEYR